MKINIIGAGLGGLTFGALAARDGHEVKIFDKNSKPGGVVALLEHEGYKFEQGPLLIGDMLYATMLKDGYNFAIPITDELLDAMGNEGFSDSDFVLDADAMAQAEIWPEAIKPWAMACAILPIPINPIFFIEKFTILRAVHKYKDSREQFEMRTHKRLIDIKNPSKETVEALAHLDLPSGVDIEIKTK